MHYFVRNLLIICVLLINIDVVQAQCPGTIPDANFADAIRALYPALIGPPGNNTLTPAAATFTGILDFSSWGTAGRGIRLTNIDGVECFTSASELNVRNQSLTTISALPQSLTSLTCRSNQITRLPALPPNLISLDCPFNALTVLPPLPATLLLLNINTNRITTAGFPALPPDLRFLHANSMHINAPAGGTIPVGNRTLTALPALPASLEFILCASNNLSNLPPLPEKLIALDAAQNPNLACLPALPAAFFSTPLSAGYVTPSEPRLKLAGTMITCLPNLPTDWNSGKINPTSFANELAVCSVAPTISNVSMTPTPTGVSQGRLTVTATTSGGTLEYSLDGVTYQAGNSFTALTAGTYIVSVRKRSSVNCPTAPATQSVVVEAIPDAPSDCLIADANFADAIRTLYPTLIGPVGDNRLRLVSAYADALDFSGWGNAKTSQNVNSAYINKPRLTTIAGIACFSRLTRLDVANQLITQIDALPGTLTDLRCGNNQIASLPASLPSGLKSLNCASNQLTALPALPNGLEALGCGTNRLSALPELPTTLVYLRCERQFSGAPGGDVQEDQKTLTVLPTLPAGLRGLSCSNNKLTSLPTLPGSLVYLVADGITNLVCLPTLPNNFFSAGLPSGGYFNFASAGGLGFLGEPRLNIARTSVNCLPNAPTQLTASKISPSVFANANANALCSTAPSVSATAFCSKPSGQTGGVLFTPVGAGTLEYSKDGSIYQSSNLFTGLPAAGSLTFYVRRVGSGTGGCVSPVTTITLTIGTCSAQDFYADPVVGNDVSGTGSTDKPWKTIHYALTKIQADQGSTLHLAAGEFVEDSILYIPSGLNMVGAGSGKRGGSATKITGAPNLYYNLREHFTGSCGNNSDGSITGFENFDTRADLFLLQVKGNNQRLANFAVDGLDKKLHGGIFMTDGVNVVYDDIKVTNFQFSGLWLGQCQNTEIKNSYFKNNAFGNKKAAVADIMFWNSTDLSIHDTYIEETQPSYLSGSVPLGAYGIKSLAPYITNYCGTGINTALLNSESLATRLQIYNDTILVLADGTWRGGGVPAIAAEFFQIGMNDFKIYNNYVNNTVSLAGYDRSVPGGKAIRLYDNIFNIGNRNGYALEASVSHMEFNHNHVNGGLYPIASFTPDNTGFIDHVIHHNVFYDTRRQNIMHYYTQPTNLKFYNNTIVDKQGIPGISLQYTGTNLRTTGVEFKNNIFISTLGKRGNLFRDNKLSNPVFENNLFYNIDPVGNNPVVVEANEANSGIISLSGNQPRPFFELVDGSPAVNKGVVIPGITGAFQSTAPDLGAYESPFNSTLLKLLHQDGDRGQTLNNHLKPNLQLASEGVSPVPYSQLKVRYWFTAEEFAPINTWLDYAQLGTDKVKMKYIRLEQPLNGADGYVEYTFDESAGNLSSAANSGPIQSRIAKQTWTDFNEADDYSYAAATNYKVSEKVTVYRNGALVWGTEPDAAATSLKLTVRSENKTNNTNTNTISLHVKLINEGNVSVPYKDLSVRYWFSAEGTQALNYWVDYAQLGSNKIRGQFIKTATPLVGADTYFEIRIDSTLGNLEPLSNTGSIQYRLAKSDWSVFNETNDHSFKVAGPMADNDRITIYNKGQLVYGVEPTRASSGRMAAERVESSAGVYPNPASGEGFYLQTAHSLLKEQIRLLAADGRELSKTIMPITDTLWRVIPAQKLPTGLYIVQAGQQLYRVLVTE